MIVQFDKATGNLALNCKRHYATVLVKELGLTDNNPLLTYTKVDNSTPSDVVAKNIGALNKLVFLIFQMKINVYQKCIGYLKITKLLSKKGLL